MTLFEANEDDQERFRIPPEELRRYVRFDDAKTNMSLRGEEPRWFRRTTTPLPSGDEIGVLMPVDIRIEAQRVVIQIAQMLYDEMLVTGLASCSTYEAAKIVVRVDPFFARLRDEKSMQAVQKRVESCLRPHVDLPDGHRVSLVLHQKGAEGVQNMVVIE